MTRAMLFFLLAMSAATAQQGGQSSTLPQPQSSAGGGDTTPTKSGPMAVLASEQYSDAVANVLLSRIAEGFTRRNPKLLLSAFDAQRFEAFPQFADRMRARLGQNDSFRAYFRILDTALHEGRATLRVELQVEQSSSTARPPVRTTGQVRFTFERGAGGWRIVEALPRELLTGVRGPA